jgi:predicted NBD/HSP70 family sugar kinase
LATVRGVRPGAQSGVPGGLRELNRAKIIGALRELRAASRADLSHATGLSRGTVASIVAELQDEGVLGSGERDGCVSSGPGRPPTLLRLVSPSGLAVAVDIGHTHVRVAVGGADGVLLEERLADLAGAATPGQALDAAANLVAEVVTAQDLASRGVAGAAVGLPTPLDLDGHSLTPRFRGVDVADVTGLARLTDRVFVLNDADMGALGEAAFGAARGLDDFLFVKMSHGLGAGLVLGGRLYRGAAGLAGNLGHVRVREDGEVCICGNRGCLETLVGARRLVAALQPAHPNGLLEVADLVRLVRDGDLGARVLVNDAGAAVGRTLAEIVNVLNPAAIVVGGTLSALGEPLLQGIKASISRYSQAIAAATLTVAAAECGDRAEVLGGLALALGVVDEPSSARRRAAGSNKLGTVGA